MSCHYTHAPSPGVKWRGRQAIDHSRTSQDPDSEHMKLVLLISAMGWAFAQCGCGGDSQPTIRSLS